VSTSTVLTLLVKAVARQSSSVTGKQQDNGYSV